MAFDCYEFKHPESEESLELVIAPKRQFATLREFLAGCQRNVEGIELATANGFDKDQWDRLATNFAAFAGVALSINAISKLLIVTNDWNDVEVAFETTDLFAWYWWNTTA